MTRTCPISRLTSRPLPGVIHTAIYDGRWKLVQILREKQTEMVVEEYLFDIEADPNEENDTSRRHTAVLARMKRLMFEWRRQHPMAGTRGTLVAHPSWVAPKDWAAAVTPTKLLQKEWKNEFGLSKAIFDATEDRGVLVDEKTKRRLIRQHQERTKEQAEN